MLVAHIKVATAIAVGLLVCIPVSQVHAGSITLEVKTTVDVASGIAAYVTVTNRGDEAAYGLYPTAAFKDLTAKGAAINSLDPGKTHSWPVRLTTTPPNVGIYSLIVKLDYQDANQYPFEVLTAAPFNAGVAPKPRIAGHFSVSPTAPGATTNARLNLRMPRGRVARELEVEIYAPRGVSPTYLKRRVQLSKERQASIPINLKVESLLPGSATPLYAIVTSLDENIQQSDTIRGRVTVVEPTANLDTDAFSALLTALLLFTAALMVVTGLHGDEDHHDGAWARWLEYACVSATTGILLYHYPWDHLLAATTTAGGDMASLYYPTKVMAEDLLPTWRWTGWTMGNYAGFPIFHFYSTFPFALIAWLGHVMPMEVAFKLVTLLGPTILPGCAAYLMRSLGYGRGAGAIAAASTLPFLFQQGNSMWGGNIPSVLAGEFNHAIGISLSLVFIGMLYRAHDGRMSWVWPGILLAVIGLCHTFAFAAAVWYSLFFLWPRSNPQPLWRILLPAYILAFLLLCFWGLPVPARLKFTTEFSVIWNIKSWMEVVPKPLWPAAVLALVDMALMLMHFVGRACGRLGVGGILGAVGRAMAGMKPFVLERDGFMLFVLAGMVLFYFVTPAIGFPDIRFIPIGQIFIGLMAADVIYWAAGKIGQRPMIAIACVLAGLAWTEAHIGYVPSWLAWNYSGYERKPTWDLFKSINDHIRGDRNDPRVVFEHSEAHNRFGGSRAFENLPLFAGRSTLEGVFHQASPNSPFIFYLQSEASEKASGPFRQYTYTRLNPGLALPHFRLFNVSDVVVVSDAAKKAYGEHPDYELTFSEGAYEVYAVKGGDTGYVVAAENEPVLYEGPKWKLAFIRWYKHPELLDTPLVPADLLSEDERRKFVQRTDSVTRIPEKPYDHACKVTSELEQHRIHFTTDCPGRPHIVKVSYFPQWKTRDGSAVQLVSPGFMLVTPSGKEFELYFGREMVDWIGVILTLTGILLAIVCLIRPRTAAAVADATLRPFSGLLPAYERYRFPIAVVFVAVGTLASWSIRTSLRAPDLGYSEAQTAYRDRNFDEAVGRLEDLTAEDKDTFRQATGLFQLGVSHSEIGNFATAVSVLERLLFEFPNINYGVSSRFHLARSYANLGMRDKALEHARAVKELAPNTGWTQRLEKEFPDLAG